VVGMSFSARLTADGAESCRSKAGLWSTQLAEPLPKCCLLSGDKINDPPGRILYTALGMVDWK
jgi:hypothetical protein